MKPLGLYIHIPFCERKCQYCDFVSYDNKNDIKAQYIAALIRQMMDYAPFVHDYSVDTVYVGGGTPTCVDKKLLAPLFKAMKKTFKISKYAEISCEANPHSALLPTLKFLKKEGFNRLSFGLQSANDEELEALGRLHKFEDLQTCFNQARKLGFDNINIDIMFSIPKQTKESFSNTLEKTIALGPDHISAYGLKIEKGTPFYDIAETLDLPDEDTDRDNYATCIETLADSGYEQYEISNFAKPGKRCKHNMKYWNCEEYIGLGCGAHSYFSGKRFSFIKDIDTFIERVNTGGKIVDDMMDIPQNEMVGEYLILRLRLTDGIDPGIFVKKFGFAFESAFAPQIERFTKSGHMVFKNGIYRLTTEGFNISNYIIAQFLSW